MEIREATIEDYLCMRALWEQSPGVRLVAADSEESIGAFLRHNPGMSHVAMEGTQIIGTALCGHDRRRGYLYHVAVKPDWRGRHIGTRLVDACLEALKRDGIDKCHVFVLTSRTMSSATRSGGRSGRGGKTSLSILWT